MSKASERYVANKDLKDVKREYLPSCPYCGSDTARFLARHGSFKIAKCQKCGVRFQYSTINGGNDG